MRSDKVVAQMICLGITVLISGCSTERTLNGSSQRWQVDFTYDIHPTKPLAVVSAPGKDGTHDLYLVDLQTMEARPLLETAKVSEKYPRFSLDGRSIVYSVGKTAELGDRALWHLYLLDLDTGKQTQLTDGSYNDWNAMFTADGRHVVFMRHRRIEKRTLYGDHVWYDPVVCVLDLDQRAVRETWASWMNGDGLSPLGEVIVMHLLGEKSEAEWVVVPWSFLLQDFTAIRAKIEPHPIFQEPYTQVVWARKSDKAFYVRYTRNQHDELVSHLRLIDRRGGAPKQLFAEELCEYQSLRLSPDEKKVYFIRKDFKMSSPYEVSLWCYDLDTGSAAEILSVAFLKSLSALSAKDAK